MIFISPNVNAWYRIYLALQREWEESGKKGNPPPIALVLSGWDYSTDYQKQERWQNTIKWVEQHGVDHRILQLTEEEKYYVEKLGGPLAETTNWTWGGHKQAICPTESEVQEAILKLKANWQQVAGSALAQYTAPLRITGKKRRRLVVGVFGDITPPWGSWHYISSSSVGRKFTEFRQAVNQCISPVEVDHIDFTFLRDKYNKDVEQ